MLRHLMERSGVLLVSKTIDRKAGLRIFDGKRVRRRTGEVLISAVCVFAVDREVLLF